MCRCAHATLKGCFLPPHSSHTEHFAVFPTSHGLHSVWLPCLLSRWASHLLPLSPRALVLCYVALGTSRGSQYYSDEFQVVPSSPPGTSRVSGTQEVIQPFQLPTTLVSVSMAIFTKILYMFYFFFIAITNNAWTSLEVCTCDDKDSLFSGVCSVLYILLILFLIFGHTLQHVGPWFLDQGLNLSPLHWKAES